MKWLRKLAGISIEKLPKIVIAFSTHGCMNTEREFQWIGYVIREWRGEGHNSVDYYEVQPIIKGAIESRNCKTKPLEVEKAWQIQHLGYNIYIHYI